MFETAEWIRPEQNMGTVCPAFQKEFKTDKEVMSAKLYITAMGVYEAQLNGKRVGEFVLAPGWTCYEARHLYQEYDVTSMLEKENSLIVLVGKGWYRGRLVAYDYRDNWGTSSGLIAQLAITYRDGSKETIVSDNTWKTAESEIRFSELYDGETTDARISYQNWVPAQEFPAFKNNLLPQDGEIVKEHERLKPVELIVTPKGETVLDFGQNLTGYIEFSLSAAAGDVVEISHAEILDKEGNFYTDNLRSAKQKLHYICRDGQQTYKPKFTFMGFRYIRIDSFPGTVMPENFTAIVVHSDIKRTGHFSCSSEMVNKLYQNVIWGQKDNFLDVPTDCPQRDERLGWTGDAQVFIQTASYNFDVNRFFTKWLRDLAANQWGNGSVPHIIPDLLKKDHTSNASGSAAWGDAAVICPWQIYLTYGNKKILEEQLPSMTKWIEYIRAQGENEFLWNTGTHFGDWLGLDAPEGSYKGSSRDEFIATAYYAYSTGLLVKALKALGRDSSEYEELYTNIVRAFQANYEPITQTEHALALYFDLAQDKQATAASLARLVKENGNKLTTGFVGSPYLLRALSDNGHADVAYSLLLQEEYPSWLFSVKMGATTIWEHWDGQKEDGSFWSTDMNSFNHYAYGAVAAWLYGDAAGIRTDDAQPGFSHIILRPQPDPRLEWLEASIDTKYGTVRSKWSFENGKAKYEFDVPTSATVTIEGKTFEVGKGNHRF